MSERDEIVDERKARAIAALDVALEGWPEHSLGRNQVLALWRSALEYGKTLAPLTGGNVAAERVAALIAEWDGSDDDGPPDLSPEQYKMLAGFLVHRGVAMWAEV